MFWGAFVCLFVCVCGYPKSNEWVFTHFYASKAYPQENVIFWNHPDHILDTKTKNTECSEMPVLVCICYSTKAVIISLKFN